MGRLLDWMSGTRRPAEGVELASAERVRAALLALNSPDAPYVVRDGAAEGADLVAELKIADAHWLGVFCARRVHTLFKIRMRLDEERHEVRNVDEEREIEWRDGIWSHSRTNEFSRGHVTTKRTVITFGGERVEELCYTTAEAKEPLRDVVLGAGWTWHGVTFGKL